jgi:hypothetical protein
MCQAESATCLRHLVAARDTARGSVPISGGPSGSGEEPSPLAFPPAAPMFAGPVRLRVSARVNSVLYGPHRFIPGQVFTADARAAERLVSEGSAEVVEQA